MKKLALTLSLLVSPAAAFAADARPAKPEMKLNVPAYELNTMVFDFPTGLRIMFQSDRSHKVVGVYMVVNHGTKDDPEGKEETAHFVEHTWFRSKHGQLPPIMDVVQDLGADFNATTWNDLTDYRTVASSEYLPLMLRLESLRLTEPYAGVTEEEIDVEREVIRNEWRRRNEQNVNLFIDYLYQAVYPESHGYHDHSTHESIDNIKLADLQGFMDRYYKPENTTIMVVGDFDIDEASSLIFENFDLKLLHPGLTEDMTFKYPKAGITKPDQNNPNDWLTGAWDPATFPKRDATGKLLGEPTEIFKFTPRGDPRIDEKREPPPPVGTTEVRTDKGPFPYKTVVIGWSLPGAYRSDHWNLQQVGNVAGNYMYSGLYEYVDNKQIGDIGCFVQTEVLNSTVLCYAELKDKTLDPLQIRDKMLDQLAGIWNPENSQGDTINAHINNTLFTRSKYQLMASQLLNLDLFAVSFGSRTEEIARHAHYTNSPKAHTEGFEQILAMQPAAISTLAYDYLKRDRAATVILEPLSDDEVDIGSDHSSYRGANATDQVLRSSDDLKSVTAEQIASSYIEPNLEGMVDYTMASGLRVVILPHGEAPTVQASLVFPRSITAEAEGLGNFVAEFTQSVGNDPLPVAASTSWFSNQGIPGVTPGTPFYSPAYALPLCSGINLSCPDQFNSWGDAMRLYVQAPSGNLDGALWLLREELETAHPYLDRKPAYLRDLRDSLTGNVKEKETGVWLTQDWHIDRVTNEYLYPDHPSGKSLSWEDIDAMEAWGAETIDQWLADHFQPKGSTLLIVGNIEPEAARKMADQYFGGWKARPKAGEPASRPTPAGMPTAPSKILVFNSANRTQTDVTTSCRLNYSDPSQDTAVTILGSLLGTKTFSQMRVAEGLAYSPRAYAGVASDGSATLTFVSDGVVNSGTGRMFTFYNEAIREVESGNVNPEEVTLHKLRTARDGGVSAQSMGQMSDALTSVIRKGKDWDFLKNRGQIIADVDSADLVELIKGCAEHTITTIVGPKDVVTPQLDELGYEYTVVEWLPQGEELLFQYDPKEAKRREKDKQKSDKKALKDKEKEADKPAEPAPAPAPVMAPPAAIWAGVQE